MPEVTVNTNHTEERIKTGPQNQYTAVKGELYVRGKNEEFTISLYEVEYNVTFVVTPTDAKIEVLKPDGIVTGTNHKLKPGTYNYKISRDGYNDINSSFTITNKDITITESLSDSKYIFRIIPDPSDAKVEMALDGGTFTTRSSIAVDKGAIVKYKVSKSGYKTKNGSFTVNKTEDLTVKLNKKSTNSDNDYDIFGENPGLLNGIEEVGEGEQKVLVYTPKSTNKIKIFVNTKLVYDSKGSKFLKCNPGDMVTVESVTDKKTVIINEGTKLITILCELLHNQALKFILPKSSLFEDTDFIGAYIIKNKVTIYIYNEITSKFDQVEVNGNFVYKDEIKKFVHHFYFNSTINNTFIIKIESPYIKTKYLFNIDSRSSTNIDLEWVDPYKLNINPDQENSNIIVLYKTDNEIHYQRYLKLKNNKNISIYKDMEFNVYIYKYGYKTIKDKINLNYDIEEDINKDYIMEKETTVFKNELEILTKNLTEYNGYFGHSTQNTNYFVKNTIEVKGRNILCLGLTATNYIYYGNLLFKYENNDFKKIEYWTGDSYDNFCYTINNSSIYGTSDNSNALLYDTNKILKNREHIYGGFNNESVFNINTERIVLFNNLHLVLSIFNKEIKNNISEYHLETYEFESEKYTGYCDNTNKWIYMLDDKHIIFGATDYYLTNDNDAHTNDEYDASQYSAIVYDVTTLKTNSPINKNTEKTSAFLNSTVLVINKKYLIIIGYKDKFNKRYSANLYTHNNGNLQLVQENCIDQDILNESVNGYNHAFKNKVTDAGIVYTSANYIIFKPNWNVSNVFKLVKNKIEFFEKIEYKESTNMPIYSYDDSYKLVLCGESYHIEDNRYAYYSYFRIFTDR